MFDEHLIQVAGTGTHVTRAQADEYVRAGQAKRYRGRLIPIVAGGDGTDEVEETPESEPLFPPIPEDFAALDDDALQAFADATEAAAREVIASPDEFVDDGFTAAELHDLTKTHIAAARAAKAELAGRAPLPAPDFAELEQELDAFSEKAEEDADVEEVEEAADDADDKGDLEAAAETKPAPPRRALPRTSRRRQSLARQAEQSISMTAAAPNLGYEVGEELPDPVDLARMMERRRSQFGIIPDGTRGEKIPIARSRWSELYPEERRLTTDQAKNQELIAAATDPDLIKREMELRRDGKSLTASGGLCAPVTPYYQLAMVSSAARPVRAALPAFNADRGGIRYARPATLASITTAVGIKTAAQDAAGGTQAQKTCQVVDCPPFQETDVEIIYHCLQFGNLGARTFPERVAQWNSLTLAAHARLAESSLLTSIDAFATQVSAGSLGLGASATLPSQVLAAAAGMRSRHRMDPDAVLRAIFPRWVLDLLVSDVYRTQFDRFGMTGADFIRLLRAANVEPSFHLDGANGRGQVFDIQHQNDGLDPFPAEVVWYLFPEGAFIYVDGGTLELGLVRDSVLNKTNDFQIFGETFENVAYVGVEALAITTPVCDTGVVTGPTETVAGAPACPYTYHVAT